MRNTIDVSKLDLNETIVSIRRVAKTVKGGRNMRFSVTVVVGDGDGHVGVGLGKAQEIPEAVRKATEDAKKNIISVSTVGTTTVSYTHLIFCFVALILNNFAILLLLCN